MGFLSELFYTGDMDFLNGESLDSKFNVIVNTLNNYAFDGVGNVTYLDKRSFNLYPQDSNQIIQFYYKMDRLTITWRFKYYQKEVIHDKTFAQIKNLSIFDQSKIANKMIAEMEEVVAKHKKDVFNI